MTAPAAGQQRDPLSLPRVPPPAPDSHRWRDVAVAVVFVASLATALIGTLANRGLDVTAFENRATAPWPSLPTSLATFRAFPPAFEAAFADRFGLRDDLIAWHHRTAVSLFRISPVPNVMLGRDDWLFFLGEDGASLDRDYRGVAPYPAADPQKVAAEFKRRRDFLAGLGIPYIVMIVPDKHTMYPEYLPVWITRVRGGTRLDRLYKALAEYPDVEVLDLRPALREAKSRERIYFKTDSHWNYAGAIAGYDVLVGAIKARLPAFPGVPAVRPPYVAGEDFYSGDLSRMLGMDNEFVEDDIVPFTKVLSNPGQRCAKPSGTRPAAAPLPADALVDVCDRPGLPTALVYRDSMADLLIPLLSENFRRVVYVSNRRLDPALVLAEKPDIVIEEMVERSIHAPAYMRM